MKATHLRSSVLVLLIVCSCVYLVGPVWSESTGESANFATKISALSKAIPDGRQAAVVSVSKEEASGDAAIAATGTALSVQGVKLAKSESVIHDLRPAPENILAAVWPGPDGFGYVGDNPAFNWLDISGTGTGVILADDAFGGPYPMGFSFPFYGNTWTDFYISSNGFISFGAGSNILTNQCALPNATAPNNIIALMWDDLDPGDTSDLVYYQYFASCPVGGGEAMVVMYNNYHHFPGGGTIAGTFEAILYANGEILIQFLDAGAEAGSDSTTGIENNDAASDYGLTYACNTAASLSDNLALRFGQPPGLYLTPPYEIVPGCAGDPQYHDFVVQNNTGMAAPIDLSYYVMGSGFCVGPDSLPVIPDNGSYTFEMTFLPDYILQDGDVIYCMVVAEAVGTGYTTYSIIEKHIGASLGWQQIATEPDSGRMDNVVAGYNGYAWSITGYGANANVRRYDPASDSWATVGTAAPFGSNYARSGCQVGNKVYMYGDASTGGFTGLWSYNMDTDVWTNETPSGTPPAQTGIWAPAWVSDHDTGYCYLTGGATTPGAGNLATVYVYDPGTNAWLAALPNFTTVRDFHAAFIFTRPSDGHKLLCVAGGNNGAGMSSTQCYDFNISSWNAENADLGPLPTDWWGMGYAQKVHRGTQPQLWLVAGVYGGGITNQTYYYDVNSGTWVDGGLIVSGSVYRTSAVTLNNEIYKLGGSSAGFTYQGWADHHVQCPSPPAEWSEKTINSLPYSEGTTITVQTYDTITVVDKLYLTPTNAPGKQIEAFTNAWDVSTLGLVWDPYNGFMRYAHESYPNPTTIYDVDYWVPHNVFGSISLSALNPGWPATLDNRDGACFDYSTGTYFLPDYNGDLSNADDNIVEIDGAGTILNAWETDGAGNDSYDASFINTIIDIAVVPGAPTRYFATAVGDGSVVYEIDLIKTGVWWTPNSWGTITTYPVPGLGDNIAIDYDAEHNVLYHSDWSSNLVVVTDLDLDVLTTFTCVSPSGFNSGITRVEGSVPNEVWLTDFSTNQTRRCRALDPFELLEFWNPDELSLVDVQANAGNVYDYPGALFWSGIVTEPTTVTLTKTFEVQPSTWQYTYLEEILSSNWMYIGFKPVVFEKMAPELWIDSVYTPDVQRGNPATFTLNYGNLGGYENDVMIRNVFPPQAPFSSSSPSPDNVDVNGLWAEWEVGDLATNDQSSIDVTVDISPIVPPLSYITITDAIWNHLDDAVDTTTITFHVLPTPTPTPTPTATPTPTVTPTPSPTPWQIVYEFPTSSEGWTTVTVAAVFGEPDFAAPPDMLQIISTSNTGCFGYWQSPQDAVPVELDYLYRARFNISTDMTDQSVVPQIRLRANASNLQQADYITIESTGDGGASPLPTGTDYDLYLVPPANAPAVILAFDLLNFNPADSADAVLSLNTVIVDRFALDSLTSPTQVQNYTFDLSTDGWTSGGAPIVFTPPTYLHDAGALQLLSLTNANTFGYWQSNAADITVMADQLYRGTFEIRTDVTSTSMVPQMRLRFNTANLQASRTLGVDSSGDGANSPATTNTTYDRLFFVPPTNAVGEGLIVSFDLLNFDPGDAATGALILDSATIERLAPPTTP